MVLLIGLRMAGRGVVPRGRGIGCQTVGVSRMSARTHRAQCRSRSRRWRTTSAVFATAALAMLSVPAFADDSIFFDGDFATTPGAPNISYGGDAGKACASRGAPVSGAFTVKYNGGQP